MSIAEMVKLAIGAGFSSRPEIASHTGLSERSVQHALKNLSFIRAIKQEKFRSRGRNIGRAPSTWRLNDSKPLAPKPDLPVDPIDWCSASSVWNLGQRVEVPDAVPSAGVRTEWRPYPAAFANTMYG